MLFDVYVGFARTTANHQILSRTHILESLGRTYDTDTVDRSLQRLEAHGMIEYVELPDDGIRGACYLARPMSAWHAYDNDIVDRRRDRVDGSHRAESPPGCDPPAPKCL